jgi:hypothetical protein
MWELMTNEYNCNIIGVFNVAYCTVRGGPLDI